MITIRVIRLVIGQSSNFTYILTNHNNDNKDNNDNTDNTENKDNNDINDKNDNNDNNDFSLQTSCWRAKKEKMITMIIMTIMSDFYVGAHTDHDRCGQLLRSDCGRSSTLTASGETLLRRS